MSRMFDSWSELGFDPKADPTSQSVPLPKRPQPERVESGVREKKTDSAAGKTFTCSSCQAQLSDSHLFCPECDAFQGTVVEKNERLGRTEPVDALQPKLEPESGSSGIRELWHGLRRWIAPGSVAFLAILFMRFLMR